MACDQSLRAVISAVFAVWRAQLDTFFRFTCEKMPVSLRFLQHSLDTAILLA
jgi:hypothetical protein